jgi:hypothetical protein
MLKQKIEERIKSYKNFVTNYEKEFYRDSKIELKDLKILQLSMEEKVYELQWVLDEIEKQE